MWKNSQIESLGAAVWEAKNGNLASIELFALRNVTLLWQNIMGSGDNETHNAVSVAKGTVL